MVEDRHNDMVRRREQKKQKLNIRISDSEIATLNKFSYEEDEPVSQIVRKAIKEYINSRVDR